MECSVPDFADDTTLGGAVTTLEAAVLRSLLDRLEKQTQKNHTKFFRGKYELLIIWDRITLCNKGRQQLY